MLQVKVERLRFLSAYKQVTMTRHNCYRMGARDDLAPVVHLMERYAQKQSKFHNVCPVSQHSTSDAAHVFFSNTDKIRFWTIIYAISPSWSAASQRQAQCAMSCAAPQNSLWQEMPVWNFGHLACRNRYTLKQSIVLIRPELRPKVGQSRKRKRSFSFLYAVQTSIDRFHKGNF